jgi:hypothetical protein
MISWPAADIRVKRVKVTRDRLRVDLMDGRSIIVPVIWFPRLAAGTSAQRANWRLIGGGLGIHPAGAGRGHQRRRAPARSTNANRRPEGN